MDRIEQLNKEYKPLSFIERLERATREFERIHITSSFGTSSAIILHMISKTSMAQVPMHFLNTGFHFPETIAYKNTIQDLLNLNIIEVIPEDWRFEITESQELWKTNPDLCCRIKKIEPLENLMKDYDLWVSGIMGWQSPHRKDQDIFRSKNDILKFNPIIDMTAEQANHYMIDNQLPEHPLKSQGFESIGCTHCTLKGRGRTGRWVHLPEKTECGLHL